MNAIKTIVRVVLFPIVAVYCVVLFLCGIVGNFLAYIYLDMEDIRLLH